MLRLRTHGTGCSDSSEKQISCVPLLTGALGGSLWDVSPSMSRGCSKIGAKLSRTRTMQGLGVGLRSGLGVRGFAHGGRSSEASCTRCAETMSKVLKSPMSANAPKPLAPSRFCRWHPRHVSFDRQLMHESEADALRSYSVHLSSTLCLINSSSAWKY